MKDRFDPVMADRIPPIGFFVHHQGRGHIERSLALIDAMPTGRPITVFCTAAADFSATPANVDVVRIPSLFEPRGDEVPADWVATPDTLHCAPLGWPGIRETMGRIVAWFVHARPALIVCDVSAEVAQLARICSVPHVKVLQHGRRDDPGHRAAYDGAAGLLVPCDERLAQPDWTPAMRAKSCFAGGLGVRVARSDRAAARRRLGLSADREVILTLSGGGGSGFAAAPIAVGARAHPEALWITLGQIARDWHATEPNNLRHDGWVEDVADHLAAADLVVASTGNTTCQQILAAGLPWIAVPEWRYFDEQVEKAQALAAAGVALHLPYLPASAPAWRAATQEARAGHRPVLQRSMVRADAARDAATWLEALAVRLSPTAPVPVFDTSLGE